MAFTPRIAIDQVIPGGIKPTDVAYVETHEDRCSRCRREIREDEVPFMFFAGRDGNTMWIYCNDCDGSAPEPTDPHELVADVVLDHGDDL